MSENSLTIRDNRTGKTYEFPIENETIRAMDLRQIKVNDGRLRADDLRPGYINTASCHLAITYIDGDAGILEHRGYSIEQLCEKSTYLEVAYLLVFGELPTGRSSTRWVYDITHHTFVHEDIKKFMEGFRYDAHPMGMLLATVGALSTFYPDAKKIDDPEERYMAAIRLIAKMPTLAAFSYRHSLGLPYVYPDNDLYYAGQLPLDDVQDDRGQVRAGPAAREGARRALHPPRRPRAELLDERRCAPSAPLAVDPYSAVAAGVAALYGPLHGGANEAVLRMLRRIETVENIPDFLEGVKERRGEADGLRPPRLQELRPARRGSSRSTSTRCSR